jgi:glucose-6-phosphate isomerase
VFVVDNVDPETYYQVLELCDPSETVYNVISKSGGTAETLSQGILAIDQVVRELGKKAVAERVVLTSDPPERGNALSPLHALGQKYGMTTLRMPANVGGRFSVFTSVGLFPAAMLGIDIGALLKGAGQMARECRKPDTTTNPAYLRAAFQYLAYTRKGKVMSVLMPYADSLSLVSDWYRQLWAESLGKSDGTGGGVGQTPIKALGVTDQHSQLQLYLEGPNDKMITILEVDKMNQELKFPLGVLPRGQAGYLKGQTMKNLLQAECKATAGALREANRPVMTIKLQRVDEASVGQLLYLFEMETAMTAALLGINAYDQPAVERIKVLTRQFLGAKR